MRVRKQREHLMIYLREVVGGGALVAAGAEPVAGWQATTRPRPGRHRRAAAITPRFGVRGSVTAAEPACLISVVSGTCVSSILSIMQVLNVSLHLWSRETPRRWITDQERG